MEGDLAGGVVGEVVALVVGSHVVPGAEGDSVGEVGVAAVGPAGLVVGVESAGAVAALRGLAAAVADVHREHLALKRDASQEVRINRGGPAADSACLAACLLGSGTSPSHAAARNEVYIHLEEALNQMDPVDREVLALRHFEELSNAETAQVLGIGEAAASHRFVRALRRLKAILAGGANE